MRVLATCCSSLLPHLLLFQFFLSVLGAPQSASSMHARQGVNGLQAALAHDALDEILTRAAPIFGIDEGCDRSSKVCDWMACVADDTPVVHLNLPGTHDTATWNYTQELQDSLIRYTGPILPADVYRCQQHSIIQSLNAGLRVFDLRYSYNPGNDTIGFYHSAALLAPTTTLQDVLYGFYAWLDAHPTEAIFISLKYESGPRRPYDAELQVKLYNALFNSPASRYWVQEEARLGTLGQARGKITLLQRFAWDLLPQTAAFPKRMGIPLPPNLWTDNGPAIELVYNANTNPSSIAYIEDFYEPPTHGGVGPAVDAKFAAVSAHLRNATSQHVHPDQLYITFASGEVNTDGVNPRLMAVGNGDIPGVNQRLLPLLKDLHAKAPGGRARIGIVLLDFYDVVEGLVEAVIGF
ncbi:hypothetical protein AX16_000785 [Volvariella volvacea WC 439]|nr:hypothetical protein AX16_000785 [Volvariella volvacea WC 439]